MRIVSSYVYGRSPTLCIRQPAILSFCCPHLQVFMLSTKAGAVGINLTAAFRMVIIDEPWNPMYNAQVQLNLCLRLSPGTPDILVSP